MAPALWRIANKLSTEAPVSKPLADVSTELAKPLAVGNPPSPNPFGANIWRILAANRIQGTGTH